MNENENSKPLISLIIPTRERADTLLFAIKTALDQDSNSYEVIISDNFSQDNTKEIVQGFNDSRLVYLNTDKRLSMYDNFEFALNHAKGEYTIFIGDDDAIMPHAIDKLQNTIKNKSDYSVFCWHKPIYLWPKGGQDASIWILPFNTRLYEVDLKKRAKFVISMGGTGCGLLPSIYHCLVKKSVLEEIKKQTGRVFHSTTPDIGTAFALPVFLDKALNVDYLVTITGQSPKSNSVTTYTKGDQLNTRTFLGEYNGYKIHRTLFPGIDPVANLMPDTILVAMDKFPKFYSGMKFNYNAMWARLLKSSNDYSLGLTITKIIQKRKQISQYHNFNSIKFLFYCIFWKLPDLYRQLSHKNVELGPFTKKVPDNISDFVKQLAIYEKSRKIK